MSDRAGRECARLVRAVRIRSRVLVAVRGATWAAWAVAAVAVVGAAWRVLGGTDVAGITSVASALTFAIVTAVAVAAHPISRTDAAATADDWLDSRALITSAWDQLQRHPHERRRAAPAVIAGADALAARSRRRLAREHRVSFVRLYPPLAACLAALFFQTIPTAGPRRAHEAAPAREPIAAADATNARAADAKERRRTAADARVATHANVEPDAPSNAIGPADEHRTADGASRRARSRRSDGGGASSGGTRAGRSLPRVERFTTDAKESLVVTYVDVTAPVTSTGADAAGATLENEGAGDDHGMARGAAAPARLVDVRRPADIPPTYRAYVDAYVHGEGHHR